MSLGPVMLSLEGTSLTTQERETLVHPAVGGVILFSRNYAGVEQLTRLIEAIHALRHPRLLVAVDHEGGRVQRFREGFTRLPTAAAIGAIFDQDRRRGLRLAEQSGWVMASELRAVGIDFSFSPVLDLARGVSSVIGDRAFAERPQAVADLGVAYMAGMRRAGMAATGKHFPGHGAVVADSHLAIPVDARRYEDIFFEDAAPFERLIESGLAAVMPAHVIYDRVDSRPAGFSPFWLKEVLRKRLGFQGIIFSDDLNMEGASVAGDYLQRAEQALAAGCDMVLICNNPTAAEAIIGQLPVVPNPLLTTRLARMHGLHPISWGALHRDPAWRQAVAALEALASDPTLELDI